MRNFKIFGRQSVEKDVRDGKPSMVNCRRELRGNINWLNTSDNGTIIMILLLTVADPGPWNRGANYFNYNFLD